MCLCLCCDDDDCHCHRSIFFRNFFSVPLFVYQRMNETNLNEEKTIFFPIDITHGWHCTITKWNVCSSNLTSWHISSFRAKSNVYSFPLHYRFFCCCCLMKIFPIWFRVSLFVNSDCESENGIDKAKKKKWFKHQLPWPKGPDSTMLFSYFSILVN